MLVVLLIRVHVYLVGKWWVGTCRVSVTGMCSLTHDMSPAVAVDCLELLQSVDCDRPVTDLRGPVIADRTVATADRRSVLTAATSAHSDGSRTTDCHNHEALSASVIPDVCKSVLADDVALTTAPTLMLRRLGCPAHRQISGVGDHQPGRRSVLACIITVDLGMLRKPCFVSRCSNCKKQLYSLQSERYTLPLTSWQLAGISISCDDLSKLAAHMPAREAFSVALFGCYHVSLMSHSRQFFKLLRNRAIHWGLK